MSNEITVNAGSALEALKASYPQHAEDSYVRTILPQIRFKAKAVLDDEDKVVTKAGTFVLVTRSEEKVDDKYEYIETVIGTQISINVLYERYRLSYYDGSNSTYISSPIFDDKEEVVKLFSQGKEIASGTVAELQAPYQIEENGKKRNKLELQKVLYVLYEGKVCEFVLGVGNGYTWRTYKQSTQAPIVHTKVTSEKTEYGGNKYNAMVFTAGDYLTVEEAQANLALVEDIKKGIAAEKAFYGQAKSVSPEMTALPDAGDNF